MAVPVAVLLVAGIAGLGAWLHVGPGMLALAVAGGAAGVVAALVEVPARSMVEPVLRLAGPDAWLRDGSPAFRPVACESGWLLAGRVAGLVLRGADGRAAVLYVHRARCPDVAWRRFRVWLQAR